MRRARAGFKESRTNKLSNYGAGILAAGQALARRISAVICHERATPPAAERTSQNAQVIFSRLLSAIFVELEGVGLHQANQILRFKQTERTEIGARLGKAVQLV